MSKISKIIKIKLTLIQNFVSIIFTRGKEIIILGEGEMKKMGYFGQNY